MISKLKKILFCLALATTSLLQTEAKQVESKSLSFELPENVTFETKEKHEFFSFTWGEGSNKQLLMLYPNPMESPKEMIQPMADMMAISFKDNMQKNADLEFIDSQSREVTLGMFEGIELSFVLKAKTDQEFTQFSYILHDGKRIWNAQLSGMGNHAELAQDILSKAKRVTETATPAAEVE